MDKFIHIRSAKFPILPGELQELVNEGMYGKALAEYLQGKLRERGYDAPFICCEDWGWWVELKAPFTFGVCIYCGPENEGPLDLYCTDGATARNKWSWRGFRFLLYQLKETPSSGYIQRTEWNVRDSDGTVVFSIAPELPGGSRKTVFLAHKHGKPLLRISRDGGPTSAGQALLRFLQEKQIEVLNVAAPGASEEPDVNGFVKLILGKALARQAVPRGHIPKSKLDPGER